MPDAARIKDDVRAKYEREADERDNEEWIRSGNSARVPERKSSYYFVGRKVAESLRMCGPDVSRSTRVAEIGCSFGQMTCLLAKKFDALTAVDLAPHTVSVAEKRLRYYGISNVTFVVDDAEKLEKLPDASFDIIFSFSTLRYCPNIDDAMRAINRKLKKGGVAILDFPNKYSPWHFILKPLMGIKRHVHDNLYSKSAVVKLFEKSGFTIIETKQYLFASRQCPDILMPFFIALDYILERLPFFPRLAGIIMVKGEKK